MGIIVCAMRGGPPSEAAAAKAIELAQSGQHELVFLHVVDPYLLDLNVSMHTEPVLEELKRLGQFLLTIAEERAKAAGVNARSTLRVGNALKEMIEYVRETNASMLIIGRTQQDVVSRFLHGDQQQTFAKCVQQETGAQVIIVEAQSKNS